MHSESPNSERTYTLVAEVRAYGVLRCEYIMLSEIMCGGPNPSLASYIKRKIILESCQRVTNPYRRLENALKPKPSLNPRAIFQLIRQPRGNI